MKYNIIITAVFLALGVAMFNAVNITADNISENKAGLNRLHKSFLSLSEEFESVSRTTDLIQSTRESYRNSLIDLSDRLDVMDETNSEIYRILNYLDEHLNKPPVATVVIEKFIEPEPEPEPEPVEDLGVNAGFGVLTGTQTLGQPEVIEPTCPKIISSKSYGDYIQNISIKRALKFTVIYDLFEGNITDVRYDGKIPNKVKQATFNYVMDLEFNNPTTITGCTLPFTINI